MANEEQLALLKKSVKEWNEWREKHPDVKIDLSQADLYPANLGGANLDGANLSQTRLFKVDLFHTKLIQANLSGADLSGADIIGTDLTRANLTRANLVATNFIRAELTETDVTGAILGITSFVDVNLSTVMGLESVLHTSRSSVGIDTIYESKGNIPEVFLRGCGVPENFITFMHSLTGKAFDFYSCFISYSSKDKEFAERIYADLQSKGVRCFYAPEDLKIGDKFRKRIDEAIRLYDKLLIVLSENSIHSDWVEKEVETAFEKEQKQKKTMLFPVRLDNAVMETDQAWAADIRRTRHIGDMSNWKDHDCYQKSFARLLHDLQAESEKK